MIHNILTAANSWFSRRWVRTIIFLLAAAMGLRLAVMIFTVLIPEEAYYWLYSQHPNLSYFDHPPMVAWEIWLGTHVFGDTEFGVRIVGSLLMCGTSVMMYQFGKIWFDRTAGLASAVLLQALPVYFGMGFIATMDSALVFFWATGMVGLSMALKHGRTWGWYVWGAALGLAMLSKYTGVFLGAGAAMALIGCPPWRKHLKSVHPYLAGILAILLFSPVIFWNAQHDWASFRFQFIDRFARKPFNVSNVLIFVGYQLLVLTPLLLAGVFWLYARLARSWRRLLTPRWWLTVCFSMPLLFIMAYKSLRYEVHINWTVPAYLSLLPALVQIALAGGRLAKRRLRSWRWTLAGQITVAACLGLAVLAMTYLLTLQNRLRIITAFGPWPELAKVVEEYEEHLETEGASEPMIIADGKYRLASVLAFYRTPMEHEIRTSDQTTSQWILSGNGLGFPYWMDRKDWAAMNCIFVGSDQSIQKLEPYFSQVTAANDPRLKRYKDYQIAICKNLLAK